MHPISVGTPFEIKWRWLGQMRFVNLHFMNMGGAWETICQPSCMWDILLKGQIYTTYKETKRVCQCVRAWRSRNPGPERFRDLDGQDLFFVFLSQDVCACVCPGVETHVPKLRSWNRGPVCRVSGPRLTDVLRPKLPSIVVLNSTDRWTGFFFFFALNGRTDGRTNGRICFFWFFLNFFCRIFLPFS